MKDQNCAYCMKEEKPELYQGFSYYVMDLKVSSLYIFRDQAHLGRCIVAYKDHLSEMIDVSNEERDLFMDDVCNVSNAIHKAFNPDKVNYGFYGDTGKHLHCHLCPKYKDGFEWGGVFLMNPHQRDMTDEELEKIASKIKEYLK